MLENSVRIRSGSGFIGQHWTLLLPATLVAFQALKNWAWLCTGLTILGLDPRRHLMTALKHCDKLGPFDLGSLFHMITMDE